MLQSSHSPFEKKVIFMMNNNLLPYVHKYYKEGEQRR